MKLTFTYLTGHSKFFTRLLFIFSITLISQFSYAQTKIYATTAEKKANEVDNPNNAVLNNGSFATVKSNGGLNVLGLVVGDYNGELELKFSAPVPANRTTFIRIDFEQDLLNALLGGNLGSALANTLGGLVLGNHSIEVGARNGAANVANGSSSGGFSTSNLRLVKDAAGLYYVAITPTAAYDRVYVRDVTSALLLGLGNSNSTKVYSAFYISGVGDCDPPFATDFDGSGLTASVLGIGKAGVTDMHQAIDNNPATFSQVSLGLLGVAGSISQNVYFSSAVNNGDDVNVKLSVSQALVNAGVLNKLAIDVYNGSSLVTSFNDFSVLGVDLLGLLNSGQPVNVRIPTGSPFNRVTITLNSLLNINLTQTVNVYEVSRSAPRPTFTAPSSNAVSTCLNGTATLSATTASSNQLLWYDAAVGGTLLATKAYNETFITPALTANKTYFVAAKRIGCIEESERVAVNVTVTPALAVPVVANANLNSCSGAPVTISVTNPDATITYRWYEVATAGTVLFSGPTFVSPALTANKTYYVEASKTGCVSATRTAVNITVAPSPVLPQIQVSASTVPAGQSAILTATSTDTNVDFLWYTSANATTAIYTGPTFVTPPLNATTTYHVETKSKANQCTSPSRVSVTVNVDNGGAVSPVPCDAATGETHGIDGVALFSDVVNAGLAIDNNTQTASSLLMPIGALNASVYQRLSFANLSNVGDTVRVLISSPGKLLSLSLLGNVQLTTYNGATSNGDAVAVNNALIHLELLSGSTQALLTFVPTKTFNAVEIRLSSGLLGALTSLGVNYAQHVIAAPEVTSTQVTACLNQTTTLSVKNPKANLTYKWYDATGVYQTGKDGVSFVTPAITGNTKYFVAASTPTGCISYKAVINVNTGAAPITPVLVTANITTCSGTDVVLQVKDPVAGVTYKWYNAAGAYQTGKDGTSFTITGIVANTTYSVEAVNSCNTISTRATATINVGMLDAPVVAQPTVNISSGAVAILTATSNTANAIIRWYATATSTAILHTGSTFITPPLTQATTYFVEASISGGCSSIRIPVNVTIGTTDPPGQTPCGSATVALADGVEGVALLAGVFNAGLAVDDKIETGSSLFIPVGAIGAYVYQRVGFTGGLSKLGDTVRIRLTSPGKLLSLSVLPAISVVTYKGSTSNNDLTILTSSLISLELLSDNSAAILSYVPTAQFDGVEVRLNSGLVGALTSVNLNYAQRIVAAPAVDVNVASACQGSSAVLSVKNPAAGVTYKWYLATQYQTGMDGATFNTPTTLTAGVYNYFVTATLNGCESQPTKVVVTILSAPLPPVPAVGNPATTCFGTPVTLAVQQVAGVNYKWYNTAGDILTINSNTYTTSASLAVGTYDFFVEAISGTTCASTTKTKITLTVASSATAADIQVDGSTSVCSATSATLTASTTTVTNPIFTWYSNASLTTVVYVGSVFVTPVLTTSTTYFVTVKGSNRCENSVSNAKSVTLTISSVPVLPIVATAGTSVCTGNASTLTIQNVQTGVTYQWFADATTTTVLATGVNFTTGVLNANTDYYVSAVGTTGCTGTSERVKVTVSVTAKPVNATVAATTINSCTGSTATITIANPVAGVTYTYYSSAAGGTALGSGNSFTTPVLTSNTSYYVAASAGNCISDSRTQVNIVVSAIPTAPSSVTASTNQPCVGSTVVLTVNNPDVNLNYRWYSLANGGTALFEGNSYTTQALTATTTYYVESVSKSGGCSSTTRTAVTVTVNPVLATPVVTVQAVTNSSILFAWNAVAGATAYEISINGGTNWIPVATTTYSASGLQPAQSVTILVRAKGQIACQTSANSTPTTGTTDGPSNTDLYVPNTFTPNGDGRNDIFLAYGNSVANFRMRVYNQWGQLVSETSTISQGWDGTFKGVLQPSGVYVYQIEAKFNGDATLKTYKGTVTLLR